MRLALSEVVLVHQFACPHCAAHLRLKDRTFAGRAVKCPDCRRTIVIRVDANGRLIGAPADVRAPTPDAAAPHAAPPVPSPPRRRSATVVAWVVAVAAFAAVLAFVFRGGAPGPKQEIARSKPGGNTETSPPPEQPPEPVAPSSGDSPEARLSALAQQIAAYVAANGRFPSVAEQSRLAPEQRLSWMATLRSAVVPQGPRPQWDAAWHDPQNDRFVRQRIDVFQNPAVSEITGRGGYPAGHFAGMAGVGADAPLLPADDRRAGIFGYGRATRLQDVRDGLSETWMVAGIQRDIGSWAANGPATIRSLTAEPYLNGPDGLGTGEPEGMTILMADGSVRFVSKDTDPVLLRRMAAMADGLPLDPQVPGEPGDATPQREPTVAESPVDEPPVSESETLPIDVPLAPDVPLFDMDSLLSQQIAAFEQSTPAPVTELLQLVGEMAGVRIDSSRVTGEAAERLGQSITLELHAASVRDILDAAVEAAGLRYTLEDGVVVLEAASP